MFVDVAHKHSGTKSYPVKVNAEHRKLHHMSPPLGMFRSPALEMMTVSGKADFEYIQEWLHPNVEIELRLCA